jgi:ribonuclease HII
MRKKLELENCYWDYNEKILGLDEAGRGAIAGPIVVAGVMFPKNFNSCLIQDSKKLSHSQRLKSLEIIKKNAIEYRFVFKDSQCVDLLNPLIATKQAMVEIIKEFRNVPDICLVDGREELKVGNFRTISVISGDSKSVSIAAASIVAKVVRDEFMKKIHENYPEYN